jgi:hypothetical protein
MASGEEICNHDDHADHLGKQDKTRENTQVHVEDNRRTKDIEVNADKGPPGAGR